MNDLALLGGSPAVTAHLPTWPAVSDDDIAAVLETLRRSRTDVANLTSVLPGGIVQDFELAAATFFAAEYCVTTNSGGAALHAALMALDVGAGDEVIVSPYTWGQSVSCVLQQCAVPVFADIDERTYTMDPAAIERVISPFTKAIVVPHIYGQPADMQRIGEVARAHGVAVVEDCAQAAGAAIGGKRVGTFGDIGCFSIGSGKQMIGGEGGFLLTNDSDLHDRLLLATQHPVRNAQQIKNPQLREQSDSFILTYRIHPLAAAICLRQLEDLDSWNASRANQLRWFSAQLASIPGVAPVHEVDGNQHVYHSYSPTYVRGELGGLPRSAYLAALRAEGVPIAASYVGTALHLADRFQQRRGFFGGGLPWSAARREINYRPGDCPVAERRCDETDLSVYLGPNLCQPQPQLLAQIVEAFTKVDEHHAALLEYVGAGEGS